jgi:hypothetical protein
MSAGRYNLFIYQGSDYALQLTVKEDGSIKNLSGYSARAQMRSTKTATDITATFICTITNPVGGVVKIQLSNSITEAIPAGLYYYDLELYTSGASPIVFRLMEGQATVSQEVTR